MPQAVSLDESNAANIQKFWTSYVSNPIKFTSIYQGWSVSPYSLKGKNQFEYQYE